MPPDTKAPITRGRFVTTAAADGGSFRTYVSLPPKTPAPALVMQHTMFGVNPLFRSFCDEYAAEGYVVVAPDLFWRMGKDIELDYREESYEIGHGLMRKIDKAKAVEDVAATMSVMRKMPEVRGKIAAVGYCMGGTLAYLTAARTDVDMAICYYAIDMEDHFDELDRIRNPVVVHLGDQDPYVKPGAYETIERTLATKAQVTFHAYPGVGHGFASKGSKNYNPAASSLAWSRSMTALRKVIGP
jgi:carboxymethylenebutenolidase